jgi:hypothetical protein
MSAEPSTIGCMRRRGLFFAMFALAACDNDPTPIVPMAAAAGSSRVQVRRSPAAIATSLARTTASESQFSDNRPSPASTLSMAMASLPSP